MPLPEVKHDLIVKQDGVFCADCGQKVSMQEALLPCPAKLETTEFKTGWGPVTYGEGTFTVAPDQVNHPPHYTSHPSGVEAITICSEFSFCIGNALKYIWRSGLKGEGIVDLEKAVWYLNYEINKRKGETTNG